MMLRRATLGRSLECDVAHRRDRRDAGRLATRGSTAETIVTTAPTTMPMTIVLGFTTTVPLGMSMPTAPSNALSRLDTRTPRRETDRRGEEADHQRLAEHRPQHLADALAPMARNSASSRVRCATMIENVL